MYSTPMYTYIPGPYPLEYASTILACLGVVVVIPVFIFYWKGPEVRRRSKFAQELAADRKANKERRASRMSLGGDLGDHHGAGGEKRNYSSGA